MDIYFRDSKFTGDVSREYLSTCVVIDLVHLREMDIIRIWVSAEYVDVDREDLFCEKVRNFLNAHYYEYVEDIHEYLNTYAVEDG